MKLEIPIEIFCIIYDYIKVSNVAYIRDLGSKFNTYIRINAGEFEEIHDVTNFLIGNDISFTVIYLFDKNKASSTL